MDVSNLQILVAELPEELRDNAANLLEEMGGAIEGIGDEAVEWKPPFLRLVQGTTDRRTLPKGANIGSFVLGENLLDNPMKFIPLRMWTGRQYWNPDPNVNKMICYSPDAKLGMLGNCRGCVHSAWVEGEGSACSQHKTLLAITADFSKVFSITFSKSSYKVGTELENAMKKAGVAIYGRTYGLASEPNPNAKNTEIFKLEILDDKARKTPLPALPFLKELFSTIDRDRKKMLEVYYEGAEARAEKLRLASSTAPALEGPNGGANEGSVETTEITVSTPEAQPSSMSKKYTL